MSLIKPGSVGGGSAVWVALSLFAVVALGFPIGMGFLFASELKVEHKLTLAQLTVSLLGFAGAIAAFIFAFIQYRRSEQWKRAEFIASEVKDFESDPVVQNALTMIDWGNRRINLFLSPSVKSADLTKITRDLQWRALLPHPVKQAHPEYRAVDYVDRDNLEKQTTFTAVEAKIRDTYDVYLTRLDGFATFIKSGLITAEELGPFINYWVEVMTKNEQPAEDAAWRCTLLAYINFYEYTGVKYLLDCYGKDVSPGGPIFTQVRDSMQDKTLAERLTTAVSS
jgi:hypothetical protein